jgi:hypothetical protein
MMKVGRPSGINRLFDTELEYGAPHKNASGPATPRTTKGYTTTMVVLIIRDLSMGLMLR